MRHCLGLSFALVIFFGGATVAAQDVAETPAEERDLESELTDVAQPSQQLLKSPETGDASTTVLDENQGESIQSPSADFDDSAWRQYHLAFRAWLEGRRDEALRLLEDLLTREPTHPASLYAAEILALSKKAPAEAGPEALSERDDGEGPSTLGRAELAIFQTLHGVGAGVEFCFIAKCGDERTAAVAVLLAGTAGLGASLFFTRGNIPSGHAQLINAGVLYGLFNGLGINQLIKLDDTQKSAAVLLGTQFFGMGLGIGLAGPLDPDSGTVSLANTVAIWSGILMLYGFGMTTLDETNEQRWLTEMLVVDLAAIGGAALSHIYPMSRGRTLLIDAGGILGVLAGLAGATIAGHEADMEASQFFGWLTAGTVLGLGAATFFTHGWDAPDIDGGFSVIPTEGGAMGMFGMRF